MTHQTVNAGTGSSIKQDNWQISCSRPSSVTVRVNKDLNLTSGESSIPSTLSVGRVGQTSQVINVNRDAPVTIISTINSQMNNPGTYSGSGIIYMDWN